MTNKEWLKELKTLEVGNTIEVNIEGETLTGTITGFGMHKGKKAIDINVKDALFFHERWVYPIQVTKILRTQGTKNVTNGKA